MTTDNTTDNTTTDNTDAIDEAIRQAKERASEGSDTPSEQKPKRKRLTPAEREARDAKRKEEVAARKEARRIAREKKRAEAEANRKPAHMAKVRKAAAKLPALSDAAQEAFNTISSKLSPQDVFTLNAHLQLHVRELQTKAALEANLTLGDKVRIVNGAARYIGCVGTVTELRRIRCFVTIEGVDKPAYLFTSDVVVLDQPQEIPEDEDESTESVMSDESENTVPSDDESEENTDSEAVQAA